MHPRGTIKAPASPRTTRAGGRDREGHLGRGEARGGGGRAKEGKGAGVHYLFHRKGRKDRKGFCWLGFAFFAVQYFINTISPKKYAQACSIE